MGASSLASTLSAALSPSMGLNSLHASLSPQSPLLVQMQQQNKVGWYFVYFVYLSFILVNYFGQVKNCDTSATNTFWEFIAPGNAHGGSEGEILGYSTHSAMPCNRHSLLNPFSSCRRWHQQRCWWTSTLSGNISVPDPYSVTTPMRMNTIQVRKSFWSHIFQLQLYAHRKIS